MRRLIALIVSAIPLPAIAEVTGDAEVITCGTDVVRAYCISRKETDDPQRKFNGYCRTTKGAQVYNNNPPIKLVKPGPYIARLRLSMPFSYSTLYTVDNLGYFKTPYRETQAFGNDISIPDPGGDIP